VGTLAQPMSVGRPATGLLFFRETVSENGDRRPHPYAAGHGGQVPGALVPHLQGDGADAGPASQEAQRPQAELLLARVLSEWQGGSRCPASEGEGCWGLERGDKK
jgi:hypothetical protein